MSPCLVATGMTLCVPERAQPLTRWRERIEINGVTKTFHYRTAPRAQVRCHRCRRRRWASKLQVIAGGGWYDPVVLCIGGCRRRR